MGEREKGKGKREKGAFVLARLNGWKRGCGYANLAVLFVCLGAGW